MGKSGWYLQKKGKFYGPFTPDKVRAFKETGKISDDTLIAPSKSGAGATPLTAVWNQLDKPGSISANNAPPAKPQPAAKPKEEPREWFVVTQKREFGPYPFSHLRALVADGKLQAGNHVRKGNDEPVPVTEILPELKEEKADNPKEPTVDTVRNQHPRQPPASAPPGREPRRPEPPKPQPKGKSILVSTALIGVLIIAATLAYFVKKGTIKMDENPITERLVESSELHKRMRRSEIPPFNTLVQEALGVGLNFNSKQIRAYRSTDIDAATIDRKEMALDQVKKLEKGYWQQFFTTHIAQVLRYQTNGSNYFTYLVGDDDLVFAVAIEGPTFPRQHLADYRTEDFAPNTRETASRMGHDVWVAEIADSILARAYWQNKKKGSTLHFICVMNDPQLMGGG